MNPVFGEPKPNLSFLYNMFILPVGAGGISYMYVLSSDVALTNSKFIEVPSTCETKGTIGNVPAGRLIAYSLVLTPRISVVFPGLPIRCVSMRVALIIVFICTNQLTLPGSFQVIGTLLRLTPLASVRFSVVRIVCTLR